MVLIGSLAIQESMLPSWIGLGKILISETSSIVSSSNVLTICGISGLNSNINVADGMLSFKKKVSKFAFLTGPNLLK